MKKSFLLLLTFCTLLSCTKKEEPDEPVTSGYTPPKTSYYKIDGKAATSGTTTIVVQEDNGYVRFANSTFTGLTDDKITAVVNIGLNFRFQKGTSYVTQSIILIDSLAEGESKKYAMSDFSEISTSVVKCFCNFNTRETYLTSVGKSTDEFKAKVLGNMYVSKVGGKLRYTTDGVIKVALEASGKTTNRTLEFSVLADEVF